MNNPKFYIAPCERSPIYLPDGISSISLATSQASNALLSQVDRCRLVRRLSSCRTTIKARGWHGHVHLLIRLNLIIPLFKKELQKLYLYSINPNRPIHYCYSPSMYFVFGQGLLELLVCVFSGVALIYQLIANNGGLKVFSTNRRENT